MQVNICSLSTAVLTFLWPLLARFGNVGWMLTFDSFRFGMVHGCVSGCRLVLCLAGCFALDVGVFHWHVLHRLLLLRVCITCNTQPQPLPHTCACYRHSLNQCNERHANHYMHSSLVYH